MVGWCWLGTPLSTEVLIGKIAVNDISIVPEDNQFLEETILGPGDMSTLWRLSRQMTWATVNIWYIAPSHHFLKSVLSFFRCWYISKCYRFLKSVLSFSKPQLNFQKIETARILLSINLNFGCSSHKYSSIRFRSRNRVRFSAFSIHLRQCPTVALRALHCSLRIGASLSSFPGSPAHWCFASKPSLKAQALRLSPVHQDHVAAQLTFVLPFPRIGSCLSSVSESKGALILSVIPDSLPGPKWRIVRFRMKQAPHCTLTVGLTFPIWFRSSTLLSNGHDETSMKPVSSCYLPLRHMKKAAVADFSPPNLLGSKPRSGWYLGH